MARVRCAGRISFLRKKATQIRVAFIDITVYFTEKRTVAILVLFALVPIVFKAS